MLNPIQTAVIILSFFVVYAIIIPALDASARFGKYISLRYYAMLIPLLMLVAVCLDFSHLDTDCRLTVIIGGIVTAFVFIGARSVEKMTLGGKQITIEGEYGKAKGKVKME